jgi:hypothetical protein
MVRTWLRETNVTGLEGAVVDTTRFFFLLKFWFQLMILWSKVDDIQRLWTSCVWLM